MIPAEVWELAELAEMAEHGVLPLAGGALDQLDAFLVGCRRLWAERDRIRAEELEAMSR